MLRLCIFKFDKLIHVWLIATLSCCEFDEAYVLFQNVILIFQT